MTSALYYQPEIGYSLRHNRSSLEPVTSPCCTRSSPALGQDRLRNCHHYAGYAVSDPGKSAQTGLPSRTHTSDCALWQACLHYNYVVSYVSHQRTSSVSLRLVLYKQITISEPGDL